MRIIFYADRVNNMLLDAVSCARLTNTCPVDVLTHNSNGFVGVNVIQFPKTYKCTRDSLITSWPSVRWFAVSEYIHSNSIQPPFYVPDWDVVICSDLNDSCKRFADCDIAMSWVDSANMYAAAQYIGNIEVLDSFCKWVDNVAVNNLLGGCKYFYDMNLWTHFVRETHHKIADLSAVNDDGVFDANLSLDMGIFEMDESGIKKIVWKENRPFFKLKNNGKLVKAHVLHCWEPSRSKVKEYLAKISGAL